ncbi:MAG: glycosyltransferase, WabH-like family [Thermoleophilia bacterium]|nr:glycosyltransferase, WabH-like family [Thermoleophilia bacterium]
MGDAAKALAFDLGLEGAVQFVGEVHDVAGFVRASDVGILSSHREGFPTSLIECMAAGIPVAGTDIPGIREVVGAEGHAFLAPPGDAEALAKVLLRLARDDDLRATLGASLGERARREFTIERMVASYEQVLTEALAGGRRASR